MLEFSYLCYGQKNSFNRLWKAEIEGIANKLAMSKVRNFTEIASNIPFAEFDFYNLYRSTFESSAMGRIKRLFPLREMAEDSGLTRRNLLPRLERRTRTKSLVSRP